MFAAVVEFRVKRAHLGHFQQAVLKQAADSLEQENSCHRFDVLNDDDDETHILLYELYQDRIAFKQHCSTDYFRRFSDSVAPWVDSKQVTFWNFMETR